MIQSDGNIPARENPNKLIREEFKALNNIGVLHCSFFELVKRDTAVRIDVHLLEEFLDQLIRGIVFLA
jgi:hypothetical protein